MMSTQVSSPFGVRVEGRAMCCDEGMQFRPRWRWSAPPPAGLMPDLHEERLSSIARLGPRRSFQWSAALLLCAWLTACSGAAGGPGGAQGAPEGLSAGVAAGAYAAGGAPLRSVRVEAAREAPLTQTIDAVGVLNPKDEARLSFKVGGLIESLRVEEGQSVKAGQVLAELKQTEVDAALQAAREAAAKASRDLQRGRALLADGVATEEQVQDLATAERVAAAGLASAQFNASHARIVAAGDGVVLRKLAERNELVTAGQTVLVLGGAGRGWVVRVGLADRDMVRVRVGDVARIAFDAWPGRDFRGQVSNIASAADNPTGTFTVELSVAPGDAHFVQGLVAKVVLHPSDGGAGHVVPLTALIEANDREAGVFVVEPPAGDAPRSGVDAPGSREVPGDATVVAHRVTLQIGRVVGGDVEVLGGLEPGARVVTEGGAFLENGERVRVAGP